MDPTQRLILESLFTILRTLQEQDGVGRLSRSDCRARADIIDTTLRLEINRERAAGLTPCR